MKHRRRKNLLRGLILAFATAAIVVPTAQARVSNWHEREAQQASKASYQLYLRGLTLRSEGMNQQYQQLVARPDDRAGVRGVESTSVTDESLSQSASSGPDNRAGIRGPGAVEIRTPQLVTVKADGFDWSDAGIGAGTTIGITLVLISGLAVSRRRHSGLAV
jgi:hypothetical protein